MTVNEQMLFDEYMKLEALLKREGISLDEEGALLEKQRRLEESMTAETQAKLLNLRVHLDDDWCEEDVYDAERPFYEEEY